MSEQDKTEKTELQAVVDMRLFAVDKATQFAEQALVAGFGLDTMGDDVVLMEHTNTTLEQATPQREISDTTEGLADVVDIRDNIARIQHKQPPNSEEYDGLQKAS